MTCLNPRPMEPLGLMRHSQGLAPKSHLAGLGSQWAIALIIIMLMSYV